MKLCDTMYIDGRSLGSLTGKELLPLVGKLDNLAKIANEYTANGRVAIARFLRLWSEAGLKLFERFTTELDGMLEARLLDPQWKRDYPAALTTANKIMRKQISPSPIDVGTLDVGAFLADENMVRMLLEVRTRWRLSLKMTKKGKK